MAANPLQAVVDGQKQEIERLKLQLAEVRAVRQVRNRTLAAMVVEGLADFALDAANGNAVAAGNLRSLDAVIKAAGAAGAGIALPGKPQQ